MIKFFELLNACSPARALAYLVFTLLAGNTIFSFAQNILVSFFGIFKNDEEDDEDSVIS